MASDLKKIMVGGRMLKFDSRGLIPAIVQDDVSGDVLMLGYMNKESLRLSLESGDVWFYSRSRQELWHKGATSGNFLRLRSIAKDCDSDALLVKADPVGPTCHTGNRSCFFREIKRQDDLIQE
jgi:phosphoribosyl-ATP pyrophosphohydrolase/phosphoribosyl-AMP cyclohydrolase